MTIRNAFPYVATGDNPDVRGDRRDGYGYAEIVIHSPASDRDFEHFDTDQTTDVLRMYQQRIRELGKDRYIKYVQVFTNRGNVAGASVRHPHSQIVALPVVPGHLKRLLDVAAGHHEAHQSYVIEDELTREVRDRDRVVFENEQFLAYCPFAPQADYQIRIAPKRQAADFSAVADADLPRLAGAYCAVFRSLTAVNRHFPYNAFIRTAPVGEEAPGFCWHVDVVPHLNTPAGLELSTQVDVVTVAPEEAAKKLRAAL